MRTSVAVTTLLLLALAATPSCGAEESSCPEAWGPDGDNLDCVPPDGFESSLAAEIGTGVYGRAWSTEGNCMPELDAGCGSTSDRDCTSRLEPGVEVTAYLLDDMAEYATDGQCLRGFRVVDGTVAAGSTVVEDDGLYRLALPPGEYALTAIDPIDGCAFRSGTAHLNDTNPVGGALPTNDRLSS